MFASFVGRVGQQTDVPVTDAKAAAIGVTGQLTDDVLADAPKGLAHAADVGLDVGQSAKIVWEQRMNFFPGMRSTI